MSTGILTVTKNVEGQEWVNTYGLSVGSSTGPLDLADLEALVGTNPALGFTDATTKPTDPAYAGTTSVIAAILGFERELHYSAVNFSHLNVSDATTPGASTGPFWSTAINLTGLRDAGSGAPIATVAPLNVACLVNRNAASLSVKPGRIYFRAILLDTQIKPGSRVGVTWTDASAQAALSTALQQAMTDSFIIDYFASPSAPLPDIYISIPHFSETEGSEGAVVSGSGVSSFSMNKPVSRQLTRGRRRRITP